MIPCIIYYCLHALLKICRHNSFFPFLLYFPFHFDKYFRTFITVREHWKECEKKLFYFVFTSVMRIGEIFVCISHKKGGGYDDVSGKREVITAYARCFRTLQFFRNYRQDNISTDCWDSSWGSAFFSQARNVSIMAHNGTLLLKL